MSNKINPDLLIPALKFAEDIQAEEENLLSCQRCGRPSWNLYVALSLANTYQVVCIRCVGVEMIMLNEESSTFKAEFEATKKEGKPWIAQHRKKIIKFNSASRRLKKKIKDEKELAEHKKELKRMKEEYMAESKEEYEKYMAESEEDKD